MKLIGIYCACSEYNSRISYVLDFIQNHPLHPNDSVQFVLNPQNQQPHIRISYGRAELPMDYMIPRQELIFSNTVVSLRSLVCRPYYFDDSIVYSVEATSTPQTEKALVRAGVISFDLIEAIFFHISRYEEHHCSDNDRDPWGMMWEREQLLVKSRLELVPVIDHLIVAFYRVLQFNLKDTPSTFSLSHDIDVLDKYRGIKRSLRSFTRSFLDNGFTGLYKSLKYYTSTKLNIVKDPFHSFSYLLIDKSTKPFSNKVLYLMSGGDTRHDNYYQVNDPLVAEIIRQAKAKGYDIGLHGSYNSGMKPNMLQSEKAILEHVSEEIVAYNRQHFLRFSFGMTPQILEKSGIHTDSTLGYQRMIGFRCGTGFPYHLYSFEQERPFTFQELPMVVMDGALLNMCGENLDQALNLLDCFHQQNQYNTHITYNVHNTIFDPIKRDLEKMEKIYKMIVEK